MKIYVKPPKGRKFCIPIPLMLVSLVMKPVFSGFVKRKIMSKMDQKSKLSFESIDFKKLQDSIKLLRGYKGLKMVDIEDEEGNEITIII